MFLDEKQEKLFSFIEQSDLGVALNILPMTVSRRVEKTKRVSFEDFFELQEQLRSKRNLTKTDKRLLEYLEKDQMVL